MNCSGFYLFSLQQNLDTLKIPELGDFFPLGWNHSAFFFFFGFPQIMLNPSQIFAKHSNLTGFFSKHRYSPRLDRLLLESEMDLSSLVSYGGKFWPNLRPMKLLFFLLFLHTMPKLFVTVNVYRTVCIKQEPLCWNCDSCNCKDELCYYLYESSLIRWDSYRPSLCLKRSHV